MVVLLLRALKLVPALALEVGASARGLVVPQVVLPRGAFVTTTPATIRMVLLRALQAGLLHGCVTAREIVIADSAGQTALPQATVTFQASPRTEVLLHLLELHLGIRHLPWVLSLLRRRLVILAMELMVPPVLLQVFLFRRLAFLLPLLLQERQLLVLLLPVFLVVSTHLSSNMLALCPHRPRRPRHLPLEMLLLLLRPWTCRLPLPLPVLKCKRWALVQYTGVLGSGASFTD